MPGVSTPLNHRAALRNSDFIWLLYLILQTYRSYAALLCIRKLIKIPLLRGVARSAGVWGRVGFQPLFYLSPPNKSLRGACDEAISGKSLHVIIRRDRFVSLKRREARDDTFRLSANPEYLSLPRSVPQSGKLHLFKVKQSLARVGNDSTQRSPRLTGKM